MTDYPEFTLAAIQAAPFFFDREASTEKACRLIGEAAEKGAVLAAFGENWLPGYPWWIWHYSYAEISDAYTAYIENSVKIPSEYTDRICQAAGDHGIDVAIGVAECDGRTSGTVYNTLLFVGAEGKILGRHRKLKPSFKERLVWGEGDGIGLRTYQRPYARIGGLNCWEHVMMLPGYTLAAQGLQVHVAAWPFAVSISNADGRHPQVLSRAFAIQSCCYAIAVGAVWAKENVPEAFQHLDKGGLWDFDKDQGGSCIITPNGGIITTVPSTEETIVTATVTLESVIQAKTWRDIGGHYSRPDVLQLRVHRRSGESLVLVDETDNGSVEQAQFESMGDLTTG